MVSEMFPLLTKQRRSTFSLWHAYCNFVGVISESWGRGGERAGCVEQIDFDPDATLNLMAQSCVL